MKWTAISLRHRPLAALAVLSALVCGDSMLRQTEARAAEPQTPAVKVPAAPVPTPPADTKAPEVTVPSTNPTEAGMRAYIDPETGLVTSQPPDGVTVPVEASTEPAPILQEEVLPDGSVMLDLKGTMQDYTIMQIDANGKMVMRCVTDPKAALVTPPPAPKREDR